MKPAKGVNSNFSKNTLVMEKWNIPGLDEQEENQKGFENEPANGLTLSLTSTLLGFSQSPALQIFNGQQKKGILTKASHQR